MANVGKAAASGVSGGCVPWVISAWLAALAVLGSSCTEEPPIGPACGCTVQALVELPCGSSHHDPTPATLGTADATFEVDSMRASVYEVLPDGRRELRAQAAQLLDDTTTAYRVILSVPQADRYVVQVEVFGVRTTGGVPSLHGVLFAGREELSGVVAGASHTVVVPLTAIVPVPTLDSGGLRASRLAWRGIPPALGYRVREEAEGHTTLLAVCDTVLAIRSQGATYRVRAELTWVSSAYSQPVADTTAVGIP